MQHKHLAIGGVAVLGAIVLTALSTTTSSVAGPYSVENFTHNHAIFNEDGSRLGASQKEAVSFDAHLRDANITASNPGTLQLMVHVNADTNVTIASSQVSHPFGLLNAVGTDSRFCLYPQDYTGQRSSSASYRGPASRCPGPFNATGIALEHTPGSVITTNYTLNQTEIDAPGQYTITSYVNYTLPEREPFYHLRFNVSFDIVSH